MHTRFLGDIQLFQFIRLSTTIEIIEAINSTYPKVNDTPLQINTTESIEITEVSNSIDPKACYIPTVQINTNLGTQPQLQNI